jgi:MaoC like domain
VIEPFEVVARNLPEHANNAIHTDAGAQAAGFPSALVAGVTTYAYLCHPAIATWGLDWVAGGSGEVRFRSPVLAAETITCRLSADGTAIEAVGNNVVRATLTTGSPQTLDSAWYRADGEAVRTYRIVLDGEYDAAYAERAGDDLTLCRDAGVVHPAVWPALANHVVHRELVTGSWIHTRTRFVHVATAPVGATAEVAGHVVDRFNRSGERAVVHFRIAVNGTTVALLEHEAIVNLTP